MERYDIVARATPDKTPGEYLLRLQTLLADRFKVRLHREMSERPVFALVVDKNGPRMKKEGAAPDAGINSDSAGSVTFKAVSMAKLVNFLERPKVALDRPVVDQTGLTGTYSFALNWTPETVRNDPAATTDAKAATEEFPSIFQALQTQLGLKLEARKMPVEILVIDSAERAPTEN
jgi:uncharacterized protein (TIGR03435 family)